MASDWYPRFEALMRHGVVKATAKSAATHEFNGWTAKEIEYLFRHVSRPSPEFAYFRDLPSKPVAKQKEWNRWWSTILHPPRSHFISPSRELMQEAVTEDAALCLNIHGEWSKRQSGYLAFSHVWAEGLQRDGNEDGVESNKVLAMFDLLRSRNIKTEWVWADVLVIPGGSQSALSIEDEILKTAVINTLPQVCSRAEAVVIIDALLLELHEEDLEEVAMLLVCGKWVTRVWTFQEIKLASRALVLTAKSVFEYGDLVAKMEKEAENNHKRYDRVFRSLRLMLRLDHLGISIPDILLACHSRRATQDIDYARAFFPALGLIWEYGMTREEGMQVIYFSQKRHSSSCLFFYGSPRMKMRPAWAPSYPCSLEGGANQLEWRARGLYGELHVLRITRTLKMFRNTGHMTYVFEVENLNDQELQCSIAHGESQSTAEAFGRIANEGECYVLFESTLTESIAEGWAVRALLAQEQPVRSFDTFEVAPWMTCNIRSLKDNYHEKKRAVLVRHDCPPDLDIYGDAALYGGMIHQWATQNEEMTPAWVPKQPGESELHAAVRRDVLDDVKGLVCQEEALEVFNEEGWTPLHIAAAMGHCDVLLALLNAKPNLEICSHQYDEMTPLTRAAECGQVQSVQLLLNHGANIHARDKTSYTPLMLAAKKRHAEVIKILLEAGADPNDEVMVDGSAFLIACGSGAGRLPTLQALIEAGAEKNPRQARGRSPVQLVAKFGHEEELEYLLKVGCAADLTDDKPYTPLVHAIERNRKDFVRLLLEAGADPHKPLAKRWTPLHYAATKGNWQIMQIMLQHSTRAGLDLQSDDGITPVHLSVIRRQPTNRRLLERAGANMLLKDENGYSALKMLNVIDSKHDKVD